jgi:DNA-binding NarL/FixJ family response regulator
MKDGANGYLLKNADPGEVVLALRVCVEKGNYVNDYVDNILLNAVKSDRITRIGKVHLNDRELETLKLICEGLTAAQIGERIFLSPRTVEGLRGSLLEKTGARNVAGLVMYAVKNGIVS